MVKLHITLPVAVDEKQIYDRICEALKKNRAFKPEDIVVNEPIKDNKISSYGRMITICLGDCSDDESVYELSMLLTKTSDEKLPMKISVGDFAHMLGMDFFN